MTSFHLDTSVQIERWFGAADSKARISEALNTGDSHSTSTHVWREWKRIVDQSAAEILNTLNTDHSGANLPQLAQGYGREANRRFLVFISLTMSARGAFSPDDELRFRARQFLRFRSEQMFRSDVAEVRDSSQCGLAENQAEADAAGRFGLKVTCKKSESICRQPEAIEEVLDAWMAGAKALKASPEHEVMGETGLKMAEDQGERKGRNCYAATGDLSIAMECADDETLLTTDESFEVLSSAISREVRRLPPTKRPPKAAL